MSHNRFPSHKNRFAVSVFFFFFGFSHSILYEKHKSFFFSFFQLRSLPISPQGLDLHGGPSSIHHKHCGHGAKQYGPPCISAAVYPPLCFVEQNSTKRNYFSFFFLSPPYLPNPSIIPLCRSRMLKKLHLQKRVHQVTWFP